MLRLLAVLAAGLAAAPALAQDPAPPAPAPQASPSFPVPQAGKGNENEMIAGLCGVQMKSMSPLACRCLAERSMTALSAPQRDYLIATAVSPPVADRMLGDGRVGQGDQQIIFAFLNQTSDACAGGAYQAPAPAPAAPAAN